MDLFTLTSAGVFTQEKLYNYGHENVTERERKKNNELW